MGFALCTPCDFAKQFAINLFLAADHGLNAVLLGDPNETLSRRSGRAAANGSKAAQAFCRVLALIFGKNHCPNALTPGTEGKELWAWSPWIGEPDIDGDGDK